MTHSDLLPAWAERLEHQGYSNLTISDYLRRLEILLASADTVDYNTAKAALRQIPPTQHGKYTKLLKAIVCFIKFLEDEQLPADPRLLVKNGKVPDELAGLRRKRIVPVKRLVVSATGLKKLKTACYSEMEWLIITLLSSTGLRASEACALTIGDCDLIEGVVTVQKGKHNKFRRVALMDAVISAINAYLNKRQNHTDNEQLLLGYTRRDLGRLLTEIGQRAGVKVTPHSLRRAYVTLAHAKGAPLDYLKQQCGHSDIKTTMGYCLSEEAEIIAFMRNMDI